MDQNIKNENKLVNPPKETHMQKPKTTRMVKVVALRPFQIGKLKLGQGNEVLEDTTRLVQPGEMVEVPEEQSVNLCKKVEGAYAFSGERYMADGEVTKHNLSLARRATVQDLTPAQELPAEEKQA